MTNRPELIEPALLRPGRLEVHAKIGRPDREGRQAILDIHSAALRRRDALDARCLAALDSGALAQATRGFSGAELAGLLRSAASFALGRYLDSGSRSWAVYTPPELAGSIPGAVRLEVR